MTTTNKESTEKYRNSPKGKAYFSGYRERNREALRAYQREYYAQNKDRAKNKWLKQRYGISLEDYNEMFDKQDGRCAICGTHQIDLNRSLMVDHDHETGAVRALLCDGCNKGLGHFKEDIGVLKKAIQYLRG